jgi:hypothetical protein
MARRTCDDVDEGGAGLDDDASEVRDRPDWEDGRRAG